MSPPSKVYLMTQAVPVLIEHDLREEPDEHTPADGHRHQLFGAYKTGPRTITLDDSMGFEKARETFLHENLHLMFDLTSIDQVLDGQAQGLSEYLASALSPVLLAWLRENSRAVAYLSETQP